MTAALGVAAAFLVFAIACCLAVHTVLVLMDVAEEMESDR